MGFHEDGDDIRGVFSLPETMAKSSRLRFFRVVGDEWVVTDTIRVKGIQVKKLCC